MVVVRLLVLSLFHVVGSQPTQSSQQASSPHPAGEQPPLGTGNLSFPWSRLRLPRYPSHCFCFIPTYRKLTRKSVESLIKNQHIFLYHRYIIPLHYRLLLHPNLTSLSFTGSVQIQIDVQNNTNWVVLHSKGLQISTATILDQNFAHLSDQVAVNAELQVIYHCHLHWSQLLSFSYSLSI